MSVMPLIPRVAPIEEALTAFRAAEYATCLSRFGERLALLELVELPASSDPAKARVLCGDVWRRANETCLHLIYRNRFTDGRSAALYRARPAMPSRGRARVRGVWKFDSFKSAETSVAGRPPARRKARTMSISRFAFTMYPVTDVSRAVAFYSDVLGLQKAGREAPFWVEFEVGDNTFGVGNFEQVGTPGTAQSLALEVPDLPAFRTTLSGRGAESTEPFETPVCWISAVRDPDGNQIWLHQSKSS